jgi:hypothetical protein
MMRRFNKLLIPVASVVALCAGTVSAERQRPSQIVPTGAEDSVRPTAADEEGIRNTDALVNESTEGLTVVEHANGTLSVDLDGRFQHVLRARHTHDGKLDVSCDVDHTGKAAAGPKAKPWRPERARAMRLDVKPFKAPLRVAPKKAPALEVK